MTPKNTRWIYLFGGLGVLVLLICLTLITRHSTISTPSNPSTIQISENTFSKVSQIPAKSTSTTPEATVLTSLPLNIAGKTYTLTLTCKGDRQDIEAGLEASEVRTACSGESILDLQSPGLTPAWILSDTIATSTEDDMPSLWGAQVLDTNRILVSYFGNNFDSGSASVAYARFGPFKRPPNFLISLKEQFFTPLESFPFESEPIWNHSNSYAVFTPGGDAMEGGPYPLIGYDIEGDNRFNLTPAVAGGPACNESDHCPIYPHWNNTRWTNDLNLTTELVSASGTKQQSFILPDLAKLSHLTYPIEFDPQEPATQITLKGGPSVDTTYVVSQGIDKLGKPYTETGYAHLDYARLITDLDHDGRFDILFSLRINTGGTGWWSYPFIALNKPTGYKLIPVSVDLGDRDQIRSIRIDDTGLITYSLVVHGDHDGACCPSVLTTQQYRYTNGIWTTVSSTKP